MVSRNKDLGNGGLLASTRAKAAILSLPSISGIERVVYAAEMPEAIMPSGNYTIEGETVRVTLNLVRDDEVLKSIIVAGLRTTSPAW